MKKRSGLRTALRCVLGLALAILLLAGAGIGWLTLGEYRPAPREAVPVAGTPVRKARVGDELRIVSWNIGYGALDASADFFMDGGARVFTADAAQVEANLSAIGARLHALNPDLVLLQEVDRDSARSHRLDEEMRLAERLGDAQRAFAYNYHVDFVPFPWPPLGRVQSGLATFSRLGMREAARVQLPVPFSWPVRTANLKRCLLESRIPLAGTDRELVLINLHLEAYDDGAGKAAQTQMLLQCLQDEAARGNYVIAGGDFNQTFPQIAPDRYPARAGLWQPGVLDGEAFRRAGLLLVTDEAHPTCRSLDRPLRGADAEDFQYYAIDGFILSGNVELLACSVIPEDFQASDHNPLLLRVRLKDLP